MHVKVYTSDLMVDHLVVYTSDTHFYLHEENSSQKNTKYYRCTLTPDQDELFTVEEIVPRSGEHINYLFFGKKILYASHADETEDTIHTLYEIVDYYRNKKGTVCNGEKLSIYGREFSRTLDHWGKVPYLLKRKEDELCVHFTYRNLHTGKEVQRELAKNDVEGTIRHLVYVCGRVYVSVTRPQEKTSLLLLNDPLTCIDFPEEVNYDTSSEGFTIFTNDACTLRYYLLAKE